MPHGRKGSGPFPVVGKDCVQWVCMLVCVNNLPVPMGYERLVFASKDGGASKSCWVNQLWDCSPSLKLDDYKKYKQKLSVCEFVFLLAS